MDLVESTAKSLDSILPKANQDHLPWIKSPTRFWPRSLLFLSTTSVEVSQCFLPQPLHILRAFRGLLHSFQFNCSEHILLRSWNTISSLRVWHSHSRFCFALSLALDTKDLYTASMGVRTLKIGFASGQSRGRQASADSSTSRNSGTAANLIEPFPAPLSPPLEKNTPPPNIPAARYSMWESQFWILSCWTRLTRHVVIQGIP